MDKIQKIKDWIRENIPSLLILFENKYVGMGYDRFASLPASQQRQAFLGVLAGGIGIICLYVLIAYWGLWSTTARTQEYQQMTDLLLDHQRVRQEQSEQIKNLDRNGQLEAAGELKKFIQDQTRAVSISAKLVEIDEKAERGAPTGGPKGAGEAKVKEATVTLNRITLLQLKNFMSALEFGQYNLSISQLKITNDDKLRGYMKAEFQVSAFLFHSEESSG